MGFRAYGHLGWREIGARAAAAANIHTYSLDGPPGWFLVRDYVLTLRGDMGMCM